MKPRQAIHAAQSLATQAQLLEQISLQISLHTRKQLTLDLEAFNMSLSQYMVLRALRDHPRGCNMSALAYASLQSPPTITGIVDQLVIAGWVARDRDAQDRRSVLVVLTPAGEELLERISAVRRTRWMQILRALPKQERTLLLQTLHSLLKTIQAVPAAG